MLASIDWLGELEVSLAMIGRASLLSATVLLLVLTVCGVLGSRLDARWRYRLWGLVMLRLLLPYAPQSPMSLFNLASFLSPTESSGMGFGAMLLSDAPMQDDASGRSMRSSRRHLTSTQSSDTANTSLSEWLYWSGNPKSWAAVVYSVVLIGILVRVTVSYVWFVAHLRRRRSVTATETLEALEDCKEQLLVRTPIQLVESPRVSYPALFGWIRPRLVLPAGTCQHYSIDELRCIFLHELAHLKHSDVLVNWLLKLTCALHWFNPLAWWCAHRLRSERELVRDQEALRCLNAIDRSTYGKTLISLAEDRTTLTAPFVAVGMADGRTSIRRRISMIARFDSRSPRTSRLAALVIPILVLTTMTDAAPSVRPFAWRTLSASEHALNADAVEAFRAYCEETGADTCFVVRNSQIVSEWRSSRCKTPIYMMSSTKSVTALLVGMLIDDGRLSLDDPVSKFIPSWSRGDHAKVTVRHLMTHTSGLDKRLGTDSVGNVNDKNAHVIGLPLQSKPDTHFSYSNEGVQLLSPILDLAAGKPIQDYAQQRLFAPLGMKNTRLHLDEFGHAWTYADMESTPRDFARLGILMLQGGSWDGKQIVSGSFVRKIVMPFEPFSQDCGMLWWSLSDPSGYATLGYLNTDMYVYPEHDLIIVRTQSKPNNGAKYDRRLAQKLISAMIGVGERTSVRRNEVPINEESVQSQLSRAVTLNRQGKWSMAAKLARTISNRKDIEARDRVEAQYTTAYALMRLRRVDEARSWVNQIDQRDVPSPESDWLAGAIAALRDELAATQ